MANGQKILHQMSLNQKEISGLMEGGVTPQEQSRLNMLLRSQGYWTGEYEKTTGRKVPGASKPAQPKQQHVPQTSKIPIPPECQLPWQPVPHDPNRFLPIADVVSVSGDVTLRRSDEGYTKATAGMKLYKSEAIQTGDGSATVKFRDGKTVTLGSHGLLVIYGTAGQTRVGPTCPVDVEIHDPAELRRGLDALRGNPES